MPLVKIRAITPEDCQNMSNAFARQGWTKTVGQYQIYYKLQQEGVRDVLLAELKGNLPDTLPFNGAHITGLLRKRLFRRS